MNDLKELKENELLEIYGGKVSYFEYSWSNTRNPLIYFGEACLNGGKAVANGGIWVYNQFFD